MLGNVIDEVNAVGGDSNENPINRKLPDNGKGDDFDCDITSCLSDKAIVGDKVCDDESSLCVIIL
jgi:hypothetical protein